MARIDLPSSVSIIRRVEWTLDRPAQVNRSGYTGVRQVVANPWHGQWRARVELKPIVGEANVRAWRAFIGKLKGQINTFRLPATERAQNSNSGVTVGVTAVAGATSLTIAGATEDLLAGQLVTVNGQLLQLTLDQSGTLLHFEPPLRQQATAGTTVVTSRPYALVSLVDSAAGWNVDAGQQYGISFDVEEAILEPDGAPPESEVDVPFLSSPYAVATGASTADLEVETDDGTGTLYWVVTGSATTPSAPQIMAGQGHTGAPAAASGSQPITAPGVQTAGAAGLIGSTTYYAHFVQENDVLGISVAVTSASFATAAASIVAPTPANYNFAAIGDSRTIGTLANTDSSGSGAFERLDMSSLASGAGGWAEMLTGGRIVSLPHRPLDFGIGSQGSANIAAIPRPFDEKKGINYLARSPAGVLLMLIGTNDSAAQIGASDPGKGNGAVDAANSKSNLRFMIEYLTDPVRNAAINAALGIEGGVCNLYGGVGKTIILLNELPRGRYIANGGTVTLGAEHGDQAAFFAFSRWLLTLDYAYQATTGYANVIAVNSYDAIADYTTIPDATAGRPAGKPAFGGGSTANASTFLPDAGCYYDGLHPTAYGGLKVGQAVAEQINTVWSSVSAYLDALHPASGTSQFVTANPRLIGTSGTSSGFASVSGSIPSSMSIEGSNTGEVAITVSSRVDTDGETVIRIQGSGTSTSTGQKDLRIGLPVMTASGWSTGANGPAVNRNDKLRFFSKVRILGGNKMLQMAPSLLALSSGDTSYVISAGNVSGGPYVVRTYLQDALAGVNSGLSSFTPAVSRVLDTENQIANENAGFANLNGCHLQVTLHGNATDAPVGTAISFDFEIKGLGLRKVTEPGYNATNTALDFFIDTDGTLLTAHSGNWSKATSYSVDGAITSNRVRSNAAGFTALQHATDPGADNYRVWSRMRRVSGAGATGVAARIQAGAATFYAAIYDAAAGNIVLKRYNAGTATTLQTVAATIADATDLVLSLEVETINANLVQLRMLKNGAQVGLDTIDSSASRITGRGKAGITLEGGSASTGVHVDTLTVMTL